MILPTGSSRYDFSGTASDADGTIDRVEYRINRDIWKRASGKTSWTFSAVDLQPGSNLIELRATDDEGVLSALARRTVAIRSTTGAIFGGGFD